MTTNNMWHEAGCVDARRHVSSAPSAKRAVKARNQRFPPAASSAPSAKRAAVCVARSRAPVLVRTLNLRLGEHPAQPSSPIQAGSIVKRKSDDALFRNEEVVVMKYSLGLLRATSLRSVYV